MEVGSIEQMVAQMAHEETVIKITVKGFGQEPVLTYLRCFHILLRYQGPWGRFQLWPGEHQPAASSYAKVQ